MLEGDTRLRIDVLGPIRVCDAGGRDVTPTGVLQRRLLSLLTLRRGRVVSVDAAAEALWPAGVPRDPAVAVQNHVFRLRRALPDGVIGSVDGGYRLEPSAIELDLDRLTAALNTTPGPEDASDLGRLLDRWQGPAYPELADVDDGRAESARLEELRHRARERQAEQLLAAGDADAALAVLAALVDAEPLRERPRALLMTALAATGRAAEALRTFDDFRRRLGDELGIDPSPSLAAQHAELLAAEVPAAGVRPGRLPAPATSLIGRDGALAEIAALADRSRLVTLIGPGGVGKTRVLIEVGRLVRASRPDLPVALCELAATDASAALDTVAAALGVDARRGRSSAERVADVLGDADALLLLDNCEHVLDPIAALVELLLSRCPNVTTIASSRERLRLPGEHLYAVPALATGGLDDDAVRLFVERARAVAPGFDPDAAERRCIAEIVGRLDGLPLAIELAAARLHTLDLTEIAAGLDDRFALLSSGYRTSSRHGSLGAAVAWSYALLEPDLQAAFADVAVFAGAFTVADAAAVARRDPVAIRRDLDHLVERSLVTRAGGGRYRLLETLRAFGAERLAAGGRADEVAARHAEHQLVWIEQADDRLFEPDGTRLTDVDLAVAELRSALGWFVAHERVEDAGRLVAAITMYGLFRVRPDVLAWSELVAAADPDDRSPWAPRVWAAAAYAAWIVGDVAGSGARSGRALAACERTGTPIPPVVATTCGNFELFEGRLDRAAEWYRQATTGVEDHPGQRQVAASTELLALAYGDDPAAAAAADALVGRLDDAPTAYNAYSWYCAGEAAGDDDVARDRFLRAVELADATAAPFVTGLAGAALSAIDARVGDPRAAAEDHRRLIGLWRRSGAWSTLWTLLRAVVALLVRLERYRDAAVLEGAVRATGAGHRIFGADARALAEVGRRLRTELGDEEYEAAVREGAALDGERAVEHALRAL